MPLFNGSGFGSGSGCGSGSCFFRHWPSRRHQKLNFKKSFSAYYFNLHHFSKIKVQRKSQNSRNQGFSFFLDGRRIWIREAQNHVDPEHWSVGTQQLVIYSWTACVWHFWKFTYSARKPKKKVSNIFVIFSEKIWCESITMGIYYIFIVSKSGGLIFNYDHNLPQLENEKVILAL